MSHPFNNPKSKALLGGVAHLFISNRAYLKKNRHILFVCGGAEGPQNPRAPLRKRFLAYAKTDLPNFRPILAEAATTDLRAHSDPHFFNFAVFEELTSQIADAIVLFPESPGAIAELGYFSAIPEIRKKLLLVQDFKKQTARSFINLGPVALVNEHSKFKPPVLLQFGRRSINFSPIREKLEEIIPSQNRKALLFKPFKEMSMYERVAVILELINIFHVLTVEGILVLIEKFFNSQFPKKELIELLSILVALQYVERKGLANDHFVKDKNHETLIVFDNTEIDSYRSQALDLYRRTMPRESYSDLLSLMA